MKLSVLTTTLVLALLASTARAAQGGAAPVWTHQAPLPTGLDLRGVHALSSTEAWAIGDDGVLLHTTDGGASWIGNALPSDSMWTVFFLDAQRGWAAGNGFFHTVDGGQTWIQDNGFGSIYDIRFLDAQHGWACGNGGTTYRTTDGGATWSFAAVGSIITLQSVFFLDLSHGFAVNIAGNIYESQDGGQSWNLNHASGGSNLSTVRFFNADEGWAIGGDTFLHTIDAGATWQAASVPAGTWVHSADFSDPLHGWGVGDGGNGVRTVDGGLTWQTIDTGVTGPRLLDVSFADATSGFLVGETGVLNGSLDGGLSWSLLQSGGTGMTHGLDAIDPLHAWAANDAGEILRTTDGATWKRSKVPGISTFGRVEEVDFTDLQRGWAVGRDSAFDGERGVIARSLDGGDTWFVQLQMPPDSEMLAVDSVDDQTAFVVGSRFTHGGFVLRTLDGGSAWEDISPSQATFLDVDFVDGNTGWIVGGLIYRTLDGGNTWTLQNTPTYALEGVSFLDTLEGWAVGWQGVVLRTTDGGVTWEPRNVPGAPNVFLSIQAVGPGQAWLVGSDRAVRHTSDGGQTWSVEMLPMAPLNVLECLYFFDSQNGWVGGTPYAPGGGIWRREACGSVDSYCIGGTNSTGSVATIGQDGSLSLTDNDFRLTASGCPGGQPGLFFHGVDRVQTPFGDGFLCVGSAITRLPVVQTDTAGSATFAADFTGPPNEGGSLTIGTAFGFQFWFRDPGFGAGFNLTDALEVSFCQ